MTAPILRSLFPETDAGEAPVTAVTADSRKVVPGSVFVAIPGTKADGRLFAAKAASAGAVAVVGEGERPADLPAETAWIAVPDARRALSLAAARFSGRQPETVVAVTGTSGKSSVADFVRQILSKIGRESASLGTVGIVTNRGAAYGSLTTPDPVTLHETLARLADDGITDLAMEASSHGIEQRRLDGVALAAAGFTNLGRDHLDYHPSVEAYLEAKLRLFTTLLPKGRPVIVNADGAYAERVIGTADAAGHEIRSTGRAGRYIRLEDARTEGFSQALTLRGPGKDGETTYTVKLPLVGGFQVENALVAAGLALATPGGAADPAGVFSALESLIGVPGRMERIGEANGGLCLVDYAHKPEALEHVLTALRPFAGGRLVLVFGCGGDRDTGKRPIMGEIAQRLADRVIVTDDNPRSEEPAAIRAAILAHAPDAEEIGDRAEAIRTAVHALQPGDVLVVAGKGHETGQIVGDRVLPFSDHDAVRAAIAELKQ
ncbi:UDP-N-acetylmuramoyl-L-alanyl-D-glutamate--2,6-diaminopimelate ligase [Methylobacterium haplocladii]|uniref:UDP-N-acetylmuramoyl-L-alanyl-D-glutamate--2,6-diaminopimelate ligase n=1 Tax=Methylobacterium haplocladii TaxID=1176176 RepID=A0A512IQ24_9HYPH|nr:UDP-N-acetylmuramoyl-L-alanyl-D-glutamate--2,6-diaminopimelate ligase [Methylobacterium haplocladii]GEO99807.1 UDP-N-acetylmuramoyl-L-alanyl-D-glutamate--2,6-diaminopimelate ligase [Methylobacterium haplocladii]GJD84882.1 UDP-N-acetylmuramoyl-L-alanyl-D-glutamate--2, 6-diaminopimelate ligase [Methylobacterium haplocladii]GLS59698.1 UDP-N-acetylmuramoyl-L-alanyl-D-glutamate--2,6-diaminopimelate ligase [Methylobacterium haplocladii]